MMPSNKLDKQQKPIIKFSHSKLNMRRVKRSLSLKSKNFKSNSKRRTRKLNLTIKVSTKPCKTIKEEVANQQSSQTL